MTSDQEHKSSSRLVRYQWPVVLTLGVALFLGAVGGGFYLYVQDRERYYNDRYFRLLNSQAEEVNKRLEIYREVMYSAGRIGLTGQFRKMKSKIGYHYIPKVIDAADNNEVKPGYLFREVQSTKCLKTPLDTQLNDIIGTQLCQISDFSNVGISLLPFTVGRGADPSQGKLQPPKDPSGYPIQEKIACRTYNEFNHALEWANKANPAFGIHAQWRSSSSIFVLQALVPSLLKTDTECFYSRLEITAELDGKNLFRKAFLDRSFDDLLLLDEKGNVLFQTGELGLQFTRANLLFSGGKGASDLGNELPKSPPAGQSTGKEADGLEFRIQVERKGDSTFLKKVPTQQEVSVGGKSIYIFALPLNLPGIDKEQGTFVYKPEGERNYILVGLVSKDKFRNETWQLSPSVLLILLLIALLTLLVLPLLKLLSIGPQDQWSLRDLTLVIGAGIVGTGLLTLALVDAGTFWLTKKQVDEELKQFAGAMVHHTHEEISTAIGQLAKFDEFRTTELKAKNEQFLEVFSDLYDKEEPLCHDMKQGRRPPFSKLNVLQMKDLTYKTFDSVFWVNCGGRLVAQWDARTKDDYFPPIVTNLSDRSYFLNVINRRYWQFKDLDTPFTLEPLFSRIDGANTAVVAIRSDFGPSDKSDNAFVAGLESRFLSLFEPIIPPGTGFAVVDDSNGKVLFHSQGQRNLREKFFEETDHNMKLKALITSRAEGCEYGIYGGNSHRFCVRAFRDIPWALVVFKNMEPLRTANLEAVTVASILYVIYSFAVLLVVIGGLTAYKIYRQSVPVWLWPSKERHIQYVTSALVTLSLLLVGMLSLLWLSSQFAFIVCVILLPLFGALWTYTPLKMYLNVKELPIRLARLVAWLGDRLNYRQAYVSACVCMLALCSVLPAAVCMTLSYESEQTFLLKAGALDLAKSFAKSADLIEERYQYHKDKTLITDRLRGEGSKLWDSETLPWCLWRLDNSSRRDVHFARFKGMWVEAMFLPSPNFSVCEEKGSLKGIDSLVADEDGWFEETYRFLRVPYNDEFARTQGLFSKSQNSENLEDVHWYVSDGMKMVSYRPVHALKRQHNLEGSKRWDVAFNLHPWLMRLPGIILLGCAISGVLLACRKPLSAPGTISAFRILFIGIAIVTTILLFLPEETLLVISILLLLLLFAGLIYMLPGFIARRVLLLDLVPPQVGRTVSGNTFRESSEFATFTKDEKIAFEKEFGVSEGLSEIGKVILVNGWKRKRFQSEFTFQHTGVDNNAVALFACEEARSHYEDVWTGMSDEEKMALLHLARNGFIVKDHPGLISLFKKGWIILSPQLRYVNESFRQFVLSQKEEVIILQSQLAGGTWGHLVGPLGFGMVFILAGLMYTQQDLLTGITALVGVLAGLVPVISKVFDLFKGQKGSSPVS